MTHDPPLTSIESVYTLTLNFSVLEILEYLLEYRRSPHMVDFESEWSFMERYTKPIYDYQWTRNNTYAYNHVSDNCRIALYVQ